MVLARKEMLTDRADKIAVDREIVPFERIADHTGNNDPAPARGFQCADSPRHRRVHPGDRQIATCFPNPTLDWQPRNGKPAAEVRRRKGTVVLFRSAVWLLPARLSAGVLL